MTGSSIHVAPDDAFEDWIVREEDGPQLGHYPTRETAELRRSPSPASAKAFPRFPRSNKLIESDCLSADRNEMMIQPKSEKAALCSKPQ